MVLTEHGGFENCPGSVSALGHDWGWSMEDTQGHHPSWGGAKGSILSDHPKGRLGLHGQPGVVRPRSGGVEGQRKWERLGGHSLIAGD